MLKPGGEVRFVEHMRSHHLGFDMPQDVSPRCGRVRAVVTQPGYRGSDGSHRFRDRVDRLVLLRSAAVRSDILSRTLGRALPAG